MVDGEWGTVVSDFPWMTVFMLGAVAFVAAWTMICLLMAVSKFLAPVIAKLWKDAGRTQEMAATETFSVTSGDAVTRTYYLEGVGVSSLYLDSLIRASLVCGGATSTNEHRFTVVERIAEPITTEREGGQIVNPCCAVIGAATPRGSQTFRLEACMGRRKMEGRE